jgi:hypothetical protein
LASRRAALRASPLSLILDPSRWGPVGRPRAPAPVSAPPAVLPA